MTASAYSKAQLWSAACRVHITAGAAFRRSPDEATRCALDAASTAIEMVAALTRSSDFADRHFAALQLECARARCAEIIKTRTK